MSYERESLVRVDDSGVKDFDDFGRSFVEFRKSIEKKKKTRTQKGFPHD